MGWSEQLGPVLSLGLIVIGVLCLLTRRRVMKQIVGVNIMFQGALVAIMEAGRAQDDMELAQSMTISAVVADAIILAIALALVVNVFRFHPRGRVDDLRALKG